MAENSATSTEEITEIPKVSQYFVEQCKGRLLAFDEEDKKLLPIRL
jgi:hypothetical protein